MDVVLVLWLPISPEQVAHSPEQEESSSCGSEISISTATRRTPPCCTTPASGRSGRARPVASPKNVAQAGARRSSMRAARYQRLKRM